MSFDLVTWKWAPGASRSASPDEVYDALMEDQEHPAVVPLDLNKLGVSIEAEFGTVASSEPSPFTYSIGFRCYIFNISWSDAKKYSAKIKKWAKSQGLHCYDPQASEAPESPAVAQTNDRREFEQSKAAAEKGDPDAQARIGFCYEFGEGVSKDARLAVQWYEKAAAQGSKEGKFNLAACYRNGTGIQQDLPKAVAILSELAADGDEDALGLLGEIYERGEGVPRDLDKALECYRRAAAKGLSEARAAIARLSGHVRE